MKRRRGWRRGVTLAELLVVLVLTGIIVGLAVQIAIKATQVWEQQQARDIVGRTCWESVYKISRELRTAVLASELGGQGGLAGEKGKGWPEGEPIPDGLGDIRLEADLIRFPTPQAVIEGTDIKGRAKYYPGIVEYALKRDKDRRVVGIARRAAKIGAPLEDEAWRVDNSYAVSLRFDYLGEDGPWVDEWADASALPRAVRITVGYPRDEKPRVTQFSSIVYLPVARRISL
jgi:prepilin-type N-terminal cleavage/methylation domain-containing protein